MGSFFLLADAILSREDALHNRTDGVMPVWCWRCRGGFVVRCGDVREQVVGVPFGDDLQVGQGEKEGFANAKSS